MTTTHGPVVNSTWSALARRSDGKEQLGKFTAVTLNQVSNFPEAEHRRTRKTHKKARTGCLTCKIRHKKCDETKPACNRCTSTGRRCDGYGPPVDQPGGSSNTVKRATVIASHPSCAEILPSVTADLAIPHIEPNSLNASTSPNPSSLVSDSPSDHSTPISEALEDAEIEAFIAGYVSTEEGPPEDICPQAGQCTSQKQLAVPRAPNVFPTSMKISDLEVHCFSQFRFRTGPQFASYFDSTFWKDYCGSFALCHPVLFAAATALGAVHRRYMYGISREAFEYCTHAHRLASRAKKMLHKLRSEYENGLPRKAESFNTGMIIHDRDVIMASEMLLGLFEGFQSEFDTALTHIKAGLAYMISRPMKLVCSQTTYGPTDSTFSGYVNYIERAKLRALELCDVPLRVIATRDTDTSMPAMPGIFKSIDEARDYMFMETDWMMTTPSSIWRDEGERVAAQNLHVTRILRWSVAYANTVMNMQRTPRQKRACLVIKLLRGLLYFLLYLSTDKSIIFEASISDAREQEVAFAQTALWDAVASRDEIMSNLARVKILGDSIMDETNTFHYLEHSVDYDSAIGPPKADKKLVDSSSKTKHLVKILSGKPIDDISLWEALGVYGVAERITAIEEHAVIQATKLWIPKNINPKWVDVACIMEERRMLLRYCHQDDFGTVWTQQWFEF